MRSPLFALALLGAAQAIDLEEKRDE
jgi:hypothetical protein